MGKLFIVMNKIGINNVDDTMKKVLSMVNRVCRDKFHYIDDINSKIFEEENSYFTNMDLKTYINTINSYPSVNDKIIPIYFFVEDNYFRFRYLLDSEAGKDPNIRDYEELCRNFIKNEKEYSKENIDKYIKPEYRFDIDNPYIVHMLSSFILQIMKVNNND